MYYIFNNILFIMTTIPSVLILNKELVMKVPYNSDGFILDMYEDYFRRFSATASRASCLNGRYENWASMCKQKKQELSEQLDTTRTQCTDLLIKWNGRWWTKLIANVYTYSPWMARKVKWIVMQHYKREIQSYTDEFAQLVHKENLCIKQLEKIDKFQKHVDQVAMDTLRRIDEAKKQREEEAKKLREEKKPATQPQAGVAADHLVSTVAAASVATTQVGGEIVTKVEEIVIEAQKKAREMVTKAEKVTTQAREKIVTKTEEFFIEAQKETRKRAAQAEEFFTGLLSGIRFA